MKAVKVIFVLLVIISIWNCSSNKTSNHDLEKKVDSIALQNSFSGIILITKNNKTFYNKTFGFSDLDSKVEFKNNDQFVIGSISKQITAVLIMRAFEEKKLNLNDKISIYLNDLHQDWKEEVTIHHLLTHTHGIENLESPLLFPVGSQFKYSQIGYELLGNILEKVENKSFKDISTEFFEEIGMKNTFHPESRNYHNLAKGYEQFSANEPFNFSTSSLKHYAPAGAFISNVEDLQRWNKLLFSNKIVSKESLGLMKTRYATRIHPIFEEIEYGYGLIFRKNEENIQIGALGYAPGFPSACFHYPETGIDLIILSNKAYNLGDFKETFKTHTALMKFVKNLNK